MGDALVRVALCLGSIIIVSQFLDYMITLATATITLTTQNAFRQNTKAPTVFTIPLSSFLIIFFYPVSFSVATPNLARDVNCVKRIFRFFENFFRGSLRLTLHRLGIAHRVPALSRTKA